MLAFSCKPKSSGLSLSGRLLMYCRYPWRGSHKGCEADGRSGSRGAVVPFRAAMGLVRKKQLKPGLLDELKPSRPQTCRRRWKLLLVLGLEILTFTQLLVSCSARKCNSQL